jgi:hypothetical protein
LYKRVFYLPICFSTIWQMLRRSVHRSVILSAKLQRVSLVSNIHHSIKHRSLLRRDDKGESSLVLNFIIIGALQTVNLFACHPEERGICDL